MIQVGVVAVAPAVRAGLRALLDSPPEVGVAYEAPPVSEELADYAPPDVLVCLVEAFGLETFPELLAASQAPAVLVLENGEVRPAQLMAALDGLIWGLLPLESSAEELLAAVRALSQGLLVGDPVLLGAVLAEAEEETLILDRQSIALTERETEVLQLLAQGLANKQVALQLGISEHTVKFHITGIYTKLGAGSRTEAVRLGVRQGLITL